LVHIEYAAETPDVEYEKLLDKAFAARGRGGSKRGDYAAAIANSPVRIEHTYHTPSNTTTDGAARHSGDLD